MNDGHSWTPVFEALERRKFTILLAALVAALLMPVFRGDDLAGLMWGIVLIAGVYAASGRRWVTLSFSAVALIGFGGRLGTILHFAGSYQQTLDASAYVATAIFQGMTIYVVFRAVATTRRISGDTVLGAVCVYLLIGLMWTNFYALIELAEPGSFDFPASARTQADSDIPELAFGYYSFVTLTTLGYGDVTPVSFRARTLSWMEAVVGVTYMATVIAFLVSQMIIDDRRDR